MIDKPETNLYAQQLSAWSIFNARKRVNIECAPTDRKLKELTESRNHADTLIHNTNKSMLEYGTTLDTSEKDAIEKHIAELELSLKSADKADIDSKISALSSSAQKLGDKMQANAAAKQSAQHSGAASNDSASHSSKQEAQSDDVVDAEFEEVKEHK